MRREEGHFVIGCKNKIDILTIMVTLSIETVDNQNTLNLGDIFILRRY